jgi:hypothetical protein
VRRRGKRDERGRGLNRPFFRPQAKDIYVDIDTCDVMVRDRRITVRQRERKGERKGSTKFVLSCAIRSSRVF